MFYNVILATLPETNSSPLKTGLPQKEIHLPTIHFQGPCFREGNIFSWSYSPCLLEIWALTWPGGDDVWMIWSLVACRGGKNIRPYLFRWRYLEQVKHIFHLRKHFFDCWFIDLGIVMLDVWFVQGHWCSGKFFHPGVCSVGKAAGLLELSAWAKSMNHTVTFPETNSSPLQNWW